MPVRFLVEVALVLVVTGALVGIVVGATRDLELAGTSPVVSVHSGRASEAPEQAPIDGTGAPSPTVTVAPSTTTTVTVASSTTTIVPETAVAEVERMVRSLPVDGAASASATLRSCRRADDGVAIEVVVSHDAPRPHAVVVQVDIRGPGGITVGRAAQVSQVLPAGTGEVLRLWSDGGAGEASAQCVVSEVRVLRGTA